MDNLSDFCPEKITQLSLNEQIDQGLIDEPAFPFYYDEANQNWVVATEICQLGGCDTKLIVCMSENDAYEKAMALTSAGKEQEVGMPCDNCYAEY